MKKLSALFLVIFCTCNFVVAQTKIDTLAPPDFTRIHLSDFTDEELDLPYYVANFYRVANGVIMEGQNRGYINIPVWRQESVNRPYNARIMESILTLTYFYCTNRPWNPYYANQVLKVRLEAALEFWCSIQNTDGRFSEYAPQRWSLAPTAFATKFMGEALRLLKTGPKIDPTLHTRVIDANRKAIEITLTHPGLFEHGRRYTNQYTNVFAGGLAFIDAYPDAELKKKLFDKIISTHDLFQSPVGFFYEAGGIDWGYNLGTHHSNLLMTWKYAKGTGLEKYVKDEEIKYLDWFTYNAVPEPDKSGYVMNRAIECRQQLPFFNKYGPLLYQGKFLNSIAPIASAFVMDQSECEKVYTKRRQELEKNWSNFGEFRPGNFSTFSPYVFLHRTHEKVYPTSKEAAEAEAALPYNKSTSFIHQRIDTASGMVFTYFRKPAYYAAFNSGKKVNRQQRYGLGLLWFPSTGALLQSQTNSSEAAWGIMPDTSSQVIEAFDLPADFFIDGKNVVLQPGNKNLAGNQTTVTYQVPGNGKKNIRFSNNDITVNIENAGKFREILPVLIKTGDTIHIEGSDVIIYKNRKTVTIKTNAVGVKQILTRYKTGSNSVVALQLEATGKLSYTIIPPKD